MLSFFDGTTIDTCLDLSRSHNAEEKGPRRERYNSEWADCCATALEHGENAGLRLIDWCHEDDHEVRNILMSLPQPAPKVLMV